ncbi:unnamed protein product [Rhizophagus irregularis]|nr:unnamed protein product [Rhizophagus irregularis]
MPPIRLEKPSCTQTAISVEVKKEICEYIVANPNVNQEREKWLAVLSTSQTPHIFCHHSVQFPELDKAMQIWTSQATAAGLPLTDMILQQKGKEFAKMLNIEDQLKSNSAPLETLPEERLCLHTLLTKYNEKDIYNADETELFFRMKPNHTLGSGKISGRKQDKSRLSVLLCSNSTGSHKFSPLVIGKANNPRCFKNINKTSLPITYRANSKAWMRSDILLNGFTILITGFVNKLNIKEAIDYIAEAWEDVTPTTIQNCWKKIGILPASDFLVDDSNMQDFEIDESDELDGINIDCLPENENDESDDDDSDEEILLVSEKQGVDALKIFINYFEQQNDPEFNIDDLRIFRKYLRIARIKEINSKKQSTLDMFLL